MYYKVLAKGQIPILCCHIAVEDRCETLHDFFRWMDDEMISLITPRLIGHKPNTYTFTKQLAESMLVSEGADIPLAIVRPSIVTAAWQEPLPVSLNSTLV